MLLKPILRDLIDRFEEAAKVKRGAQEKKYSKLIPYAYGATPGQVDALVSSIALAHADMARRATGHTDDVKKESVLWWAKYFLDSKTSPFSTSFKKRVDFDNWHFNACNSYSIDMNNKSFVKPFVMTFGRAQKVLNMTFKYLYCTAEYKSKVEGIIEYLHMTLDGYTLRWYKEQIVSKVAGLKVSDVSDWSKMNEAKKHQYIEIKSVSGNLEEGKDGIQNRIRAYLTKTPYYEYKINIENIDQKEDEEDSSTTSKTISIGQRLDASDTPFLAEFIIWEGEIVRAKIESLFKGINGCYKTWTNDDWAINQSIKDELKLKIDCIRKYL